MTMRRLTLNFSTYGGGRRRNQNPWPSCFLLAPLMSPTLKMLFFEKRTPERTA
nr:hypothetical protein [uncultured bacterium]